jgi:hypothetical protein
LRLGSHQADESGETPISQVPVKWFRETSTLPDGTFHVMTSGHPGQVVIEVHKDGFETKQTPINSDSRWLICLQPGTTSAPAAAPAESAASPVPAASAR